MIGILDLRSLGYYKIQQNLSKSYNFESAEKVCNQFNNLINTLKREETIETGGKYPWLDNTGESICQIGKYQKSLCLHKEEKEEVMDMVYKYKGSI